MRPATATSDPGEHMVPETDDKGSSVLVTGAGSGIGRAIALGFARARAAVLAADIDMQALLMLQKEARRDSLVLTTQVADMRSEPEVRGLVAAAAQQVPLGVVVHCAGITVRRSLTETSEDEYRAVLETNLTGTFYCLRAAALQMQQQGRGGSIVVITSINAQWPLATQAVYTATKAAIESLTKSLAVEMARHGVRVNAVAPGAIDTPMNTGVLGQSQRELLDRRIPLGRIGRAQDMVGVVRFLASSEAAYITGATVVVDGGMMISR